MGDVLLTTDETPLAWPASVGLSEVTTSSTSQLNLFAPNSGSLQVLTRRQGAGDGVNIEESNSVGADFRGQRYTLEEVVLNIPGVHVFPGQSAVYPAELHIHMKTFSAPQRGITIVVPASHLVDPGKPGADYFAAAKAQPDPAATRPTLASVIPSAQMLIYRGPEIRGRTADTPVVAADSVGEDRQFLLVLDTAFIRATDLERIPREGSLSTDPRNLPAPGVKANVTVPQDRLLRCTVLANPGISIGSPASGPGPAPAPAPITELECKPVKVVNGRDVIDVQGKSVDLAKMLGFDISGTPSQQTSTGNIGLANNVLLFIGTFVGLLIADFILGFVWSICFESSELLKQWEPLKIWVFVSIALGSASGATNVMQMISKWFSFSPT